MKQLKLGTVAILVSACALSGFDNLVPPPANASASTAKTSPTDVQRKAEVQAVQKMIGQMPGKQALLLAHKFLSEKKYGAALVFYMRVIATLPSGQTYLERGLVYELLDDNQHALADYEMTTKLDPKNKFGWVDRASMLASFEKFEDALQSCNKATALDPKYARSYVIRALCYRRADHPDQSATDLNLAKTLDPKNPDVFTGLGYTYLALKQYDQAVENFTKAISLGAGNTALDGRLQAYQSQKKFDLALADAKEMIRRNPTAAIGYYRTGIILDGQEKYAEAGVAFSKAVVLNPKQVDYIYSLARELQRLHQPELAAELYSKIIELTTHDFESYFNRGKCFAMMGKYTAALKDYNKCCELKPEAGAELTWISAQMLEDAGDFEDALKLLDQLASGYSKDVDIKNERANVLINLGKFEDAVAAFNQLIDTSSDIKPIYYLGRALAYADLGKKAEMEADLAKVTKSDDATIFVARAKCYQAAGASEQALLNLQAALKLEPTNVAALERQASINMELGHFQEAFDGASKAIDKSPTAFSLYLRAYLYLNMRDLDHAQKDIAAAEKFRDTSMRSYLTRALYFQYKGEPKKTVEICTDGLTNYPDSPTLLSRRAAGFDSLHDFRSAIDDLTKIVAAHPNDPDYCSLRAVYLKHAGRLDEALTDINKAISLAPNDAAFLKERAEIQASQKSFEQALADYAKAETLSPKDGDAAASRGYIYEELNKKEEALAEFEKAIQIDPANAVGYEARARFYFGTDVNAVVREASRGIAALPNDPICYGVRSEAYNDLREFQKAYDDASQAIKLAPNSVLYYNERGNSALGLGDYAQALKDFRQVVSLDSSPRRHYHKGVLEYCVGQYEKAAEDFCVSIDPTDWSDGDQHPTYAAILANLSYRQIHQDAKAREVLNRRDLSTSKWPYPIVDFLKGSLTREALIEKATTGGTTDNTKLTEVKTYLALDAALKGQEVPAESDLRWVLQNGERSEDEFYIASAHFSHADKTIVEADPMDRKTVVPAKIPTESTNQGKASGTIPTKTAEKQSTTKAKPSSNARASSTKIKMTSLHKAAKTKSSESSPGTVEEIIKRQTNAHAPASELPGLLRK